MLAPRRYTLFDIKNKFDIVCSDVSSSSFIVDGDDGDSSSRREISKGYIARYIPEHIQQLLIDLEKTTVHLSEVLSNAYQQQQLNRTHHGSHGGRSRNTGGTTGGGGTNRRPYLRKPKSEDKWSSVPSTPAPVFVPTKMQTKEGVEKDMDDIRISLNKISNKNFDTHRENILTLVKRVKETSEEDDSPFHKICQFIFSIASTNKFYSDLYGDLYQALSEEYSIFSDILREFVSNFQHTIRDMKHVDEDVDYDAFCEYTKNNDKRRATASFLVILMQRRVLDKSTVLDIIRHFQETMMVYIDEENRTKEVEELSEILYLLITLSHVSLSETDEWRNRILPQDFYGADRKAHGKCSNSGSLKRVAKAYTCTKKLGKSPKRTGSAFRGRNPLHRRRTMKKRS